MVNPDRVQKAINAISNGDMKTLRLMLKGGVPANHTERSVYGGRTESLLSIAAHHGQTEAFELLLSEGADIDFRATMVAEHEYSMLEVACSDSPSPRIVQIILNKATVTQQDKNFAFVSASYNSLELVNLLIDAGADVNAEGRFGGTALLNAVMARKEPIALRLLDAGADPSARQLNADLDYWKKSAAQIARELNMPDVIRKLEGCGEPPNAGRNRTFSTVAECWEAIDQTLGDRNLRHRLPAAAQPSEALAEWSRQPALRELVESLKCHDGSGVLELFVVPHNGAFAFWAVEDIDGAGKMMTQISEEEAASGIDEAFWNPAWLPFAANGAGDYLVVDSSPHNPVSPVKLFDHELRTTSLLWPSILAMLTDVANDLIDGVFSLEA